MRQTIRIMAAIMAITLMAGLAQGQIDSGNFNTANQDQESTQSSTQSDMSDTMRDDTQSKTQSDFRRDSKRRLLQDQGSDMNRDQQDRGDRLDQNQQDRQQPGDKDANHWRYRRHDGRWWYWSSKGHWLYHDNGKWQRSYDPPQKPVEMGESSQDMDHPECNEVYYDEHGNQVQPSREYRDRGDQSQSRKSRISESNGKESSNGQNDQDHTTNEPSNQ